MPPPTTPSVPAAASTGIAHPSSTIHRQIQHLLWISLGLSTIAIALSMVHAGALSFYAAPAAFGLSFIYNVTRLALSRKERKAGPEALAGKLPATARKATIISGWFIALVWAAAVGVTAALVIIITSWGRVEKRSVIIVGHFEWVFGLFEMFVMGFLALKCTRERQQIVGLANTARWYQLGNYDM
ncbi:hypothetical protein NLJ89_g9325 [Agrocybe chaxingu]|uniref:Uncharacterized protein n=1 Tax=Agrocybe chaxingu TaxID=84603 RepID=A0A9W8MRC1_9AGAR|nr:hypothetical protein NLJ89_g9325 [Agrocybe chaxingu]